jgi:hypothetical protein
MAAVVAGADGVEVVHALPGRTRLRVGALALARPREASAYDLAEALARVAGVSDVEVRAATGSVLCLHDAALGAEVLAVEASRAAAALGLLERAAPPPSRPAGSRATIARELAKLVRELDDRVMTITEGRMDLATMATIGLFGAGALDAASAGRLTAPRWFDLAWWGTQTFASFERPPDDRPRDDDEET